MDTLASSGAAAARLREAASRTLRFRVNGRPVELVDPDPRTTLAEFLRDSGQKGTKIACAQGGCGACSVIVSRRTPAGLDHRPVNACLRPLVACDGEEITTVEGLGDPTRGLDPVQHEIARYNGTQCGFCTPGFVTTMRALLSRNPAPTRREIEDALGGNLCRCTGYRTILHGLRQFACDGRPEDEPLRCVPAEPVAVRPEPVTPGRALAEEPAPASGTADPRCYRAGGHEWLRPADLDEALALRADLGAEGARYVAGCTSFGLFPGDRPAIALDVSHLPELRVLEILDDGLRVGAAVPVQDLLELARRAVGELPAERTRGLRELLRHGNQVAGLQVRSAGSVGGNLMMVSRHARAPEPFVSDLQVVLGTLGARLTLHAAAFPEGRRELDLLDLPPTEALPDDALAAAITIPFTQPDEHVFTARVAVKRQMSHPVVNGGLRCRVDADGRVRAGSVRVVFGGLASGALRLPRTEEVLGGRGVASLRAVMGTLAQELAGAVTPLAAWRREGVDAAARERIARGLFYRHLLRLAEEAHAGVPERERSALDAERPLARGQYDYPTDEARAPLTRPLAKAEGFAQAAGEVRYAYDESPPEGGLHAAVVLSPHAHARFRFEPSLDGLEQRLRTLFPGFEALVTADDVPGSRVIGIGLDDPVFHQDVATHHGARLGLALARDRHTAREAAAWVVRHGLHFEPLPATITLEQAIARGELLPREEPGPQVFVRPGTDVSLLDPATPPPEGVRVVEGTVATGHQAHFGLELRSALATPGRGDEMHVVSCTQFPSGEQSHIARILGVPLNRVTVEVNQVGGGFGSAHHGSAQFSTMTAVAAHKARRPVKLETTREENMLLIGKRHPFLGRYRVLHRDDGEIVGMDLDYQSNGGATVDASWQILGLGSMLADNCYHVPHLRVSGRTYRSNVTTNTAFRSFGQVQSHLIVETAIEHVAWALRQRGIDLSAEDVRRRNFYRSSDGDQDSDRNHLGQPLGRVRIREQFDELHRTSDFAARSAAVARFNAANRWRKRGIAILPIKYGVGLKHIAEMKSGSALVNVNRDDGSVMILHGGVEMGQGLNQRILQLAAWELGLPVSRLHVGRNTTDAIANAPATAASSGFDLNGGAVALACRELKQRLLGVWRDMGHEGGARDPGWSDQWQALVDRAFCDGVRICAGATFYMRVRERPEPGREAEFDMGRDMFTYFVYGYTASEVELDVLTGEYTLLRSDLLYDTGRPASPAMDLGQVEGGFLQGVGLGTCEELRFDEESRLVTDNVWSYELPSATSIPVDFRLSLARTEPEVLDRLEAEGRLAVAGSKATGEPGVSTGNSVFFALRNALLAAREELGLDGWPALDAPATGFRLVGLLELPDEAFTE